MGHPGKARTSLSPLTLPPLWVWGGPKSCAGPLGEAERNGVWLPIWRKVLSCHLGDSIPWQVCMCVLVYGCCSGRPRRPRVFPVLSGDSILSAPLGSGEKEWRGGLEGGTPLFIAWLQPVSSSRPGVAGRLLELLVGWCAQRPLARLGSHRAAAQSQTIGSRSLCFISAKRPGAECVFRGSSIRVSFSALKARPVSKSVPHGSAPGHALFFLGCCPSQSVLSLQHVNPPERRALSSLVPLSFPPLVTETSSMCGALKVKLIPISTCRHIL